MGDLQSLYSQARKLLLSVGEGLEKIESAERRGTLTASLRSIDNSSNGAVEDPVTRTTRDQLLRLQKLSAEMDGVWRMQALTAAPSKRDVWKRKVEQIGEETEALQVAFDRLMVRVHGRRQEEEQRQELLRRRAGGDPFGDINAEVASHRHIQNSKSVIEEAYQTGIGILGAMDSQRERLKSAHRKALDVINAVGLSDSVLRLAERRIAVDKLIAYGGMAAISLLFIALVYWLR